MLEDPLQVQEVAARRHNCEEQSQSIVALIPALRAFSRTFCKDPNDADDLVQETLTKGITSIHQFKPGTRMKSWLFTIMRNTFYTRIRISTRESPGLIDCASLRLVSEATQEWTVQSREVSSALGMLPENQREVLMLIGVLGMSYEEAADICSCAVGTIKSRLNRARSSLLELLGEGSAQSVVDHRRHLPSDYISREVARRN